MFWEPRQLLYEGFDQPSGYIEPESRVCACVCEEHVVVIHVSSCV